MTKRVHGTLLVLGTVGALMASSAVYSQSLTQKSVCVSVGSAGSSAMEPLGDREGHSISVSQYACRVEGGVLDGGVLTGNNIFEWNGTNGIFVAGTGVIRKPGSTVSFNVLDGKISPIVTDGKVTGFAGSGRGKYQIAVGPSSPLAGKTYNYTFKFTGPGQFVIESTVVD